MTYSTCNICGNEGRDDLIPGWYYLDGKMVCDKCANRIIRIYEERGKP